MNDDMKAIYKRGNFVVIDTETTGLKRPAEIIDICVLNSNGVALIDTLVKPKAGISPFITDLTGITNEMVTGAAIWPIVKPYVLSYIKGKDVITYNAKFDRHMFHCSDDMWELGQTDYHADSEWVCAMEAYAPHGGEWDDYHQSYRWVKLGSAMLQQGLALETAHRASADARMTYRLLTHMCKP